MAASHAAMSANIGLVPTIWPLPDFRLKYGRPSAAAFSS